MIEFFTRIDSTTEITDSGYPGVKTKNYSAQSQLKQQQMVLSESRQRRTFPLDSLEVQDDGDHSVPVSEEASSRSTLRRSLSTPTPKPASSSSNSTSGRSEHTGIQSTSTGSSHRRRRKKSDRSKRFGNDGPIRQPRRTGSVSSRGSTNSKASVASTAKTGSTHSRGMDSTVSLDIEELRQCFNRNESAPHSQVSAQHSHTNYHSSGSNLHSSHLLTPSATRLRSLTIGNSSNLSESRSMLRHNVSEDDETSRNSTGSVIPDLFGLEQALHEADEEKVAEGVKSMLDRKARRERRRKERSSTHSARSSGSSRTKTPVAWKTPFEVDLPRDAPVAKLLTDEESEAPPPVKANNLGSHLTDEQNAWAGIDSLLDMQSVDGSCAISTTDILPHAIVRALKRQQSRSSVLHENNSDDGDADENDASNLRLSEIGSSNFLGNSRELAGSRLDSQQLGAGSGGLFDMFHWSEKDNVDESRQRKKKLNQPHKLRVTIKTNSTHSTKHKQTKISDESSLPSLSSFHDDDAASRSSKSAAAEWDAIVSSGKRGLESKVPPIKEEVEYHGENGFGVRFANNERQTGFNGEGPGEEKAIEEDKPDEGLQSSTKHGLLNDGLVLNEQVDSYIQQIQAALPSIVGDDPATHMSRNGKHLNIPLPGILERPCPTSVAEDEMSAAQELPSLASLGHGQSHPITNGGLASASAKGSRRDEKKREVKLSLAHQLRNSIKKIREKGKSSKSTGRSEEKYFPEELVNPKPSSARSLLTQGADGVNWESS